MPGVGRVASSWLPPLAWMAIIFAFSAQHGGGHLPDGRGRAAQARARGRLSRADAAARCARCAARASAVAVPAALAAALAYAISDEWHQSFVPGRGATPRDVAIDGIGIALAGARGHAHAPARARRHDARPSSSPSAPSPPAATRSGRLALEHLARRFASIRELDVAGVPARESRRRGARGLGGRGGELVAARARALLRRPRAHAPAARSRHGRAARGAARRRRAAGGLRPGPARGLGRDARVPRARPAPRRGRAGARRRRLRRVPRRRSASPRRRHVSTREELAELRQ